MHVPHTCQYYISIFINKCVLYTVLIYLLYLFNIKNIINLLFI